MSIIATNKSQVTRFVTVGLFGTLIGLAIYAVVYSLVQVEPRAAIAWLLSSIVGIWKQHGLHRLFTFTDSKEPYLQSLLKGYAGYSAIIISGTSLQWYFVSILGFQHYYSWIMIKIMMTGFSLFILRRFVFKPETSGDSDTEE